MKNQTTPFSQVRQITTMNMWLSKNHGILGMAPNNDLEAARLQRQRRERRARTFITQCKARNHA